jgi:hypothetical protein
MTTPDDHDLVALLGTLRRAESADAAPADVEAAVMHAWDAAHPASVAPVPLTMTSRIASLAAVAVLAVGLGVLGERLRSAQIVAPSPAAETSPTVILVGEPVLDGEQMRVVRMRMPAAALHTLGVTSTSAIDVDVDVIVGEDGVARALSLNP